MNTVNEYRNIVDELAHIKFDMESPCNDMNYLTKREAELFEKAIPLNAMAHVEQELKSDSKTKIYDYEYITDFDNKGMTNLIYLTAMLYMETDDLKKVKIKTQIAESLKTNLSLYAEECLKKDIEARMEEIEGEYETADDLKDRAYMQRQAYLPQSMI